MTPEADRQNSRFWNRTILYTLINCAILAPALVWGQDTTESLQITQDRSRLQVLLLVVCIILMVVVAILFFKRYRDYQEQKLQQQKLQDEQLRLQTIIEVQEMERGRVAQDLHDHIGQMLTAAQLNFGQLEKTVQGLEAEEVRQYHTSMDLLKETAHELRVLSRQMMPVTLKELGLEQAIRELLEKTVRPTQIQYEFDVHQLQSRLSPDLETGIYRIIQELVTNVIKHSEATELQIQLLQKKQSLLVIVEDNGKGLPVEEVSNGMGMQNIQLRANAMDASLSFDLGMDGKGALVRLKIPLQPSSKSV